jgi:hypothetical protein
MKNKILIWISFAIFNLIAPELNAQISPKLLIGEWRLDSIGYKHISDSEKQKRYIYTTDSLTFKSPKIYTSGPYKLLQDSTSHEWSIPQAPKPLLTIFTFISTDTLKIADGTNPNDYGFLVRISDQAINHYKNGLQSEKEKNFSQAFSEFSKAAHLQHPDAMYKLGMHYFTGNATKLDDKEGSKWIRAAAKLGNAEAQAIVNSNSLEISPEH